MVRVWPPLPHPRRHLAVAGQRHTGLGGRLTLTVTGWAPTRTTRSALLLPKCPAGQFDLIPSNPCPALLRRHRPGLGRLLAEPRVVYPVRPVGLDADAAQGVGHL